MTNPGWDARTALAQTSLNARAAGFWALRDDSLVQLAFEAAPDMPDMIAREFAEATRIVPVDRLELGIVKAAVDRRVVVSIAADLDPGAGSGFWLRAFGADRSIAVPRFDRAGTVVGVFSVAMPGKDPDADTVRSVLEAIDQG